MTAVFADVCRKQGTLDPCIGRPSVKVQFDCLWWRADTDFGDVQCVVFDIFDLYRISRAKRVVVRMLTYLDFARATTVRTVYRRRDAVPLQSSRV